MIVKRSHLPSLNRLVLILGFSGFVSAANSWFVSPVLPAMANSFGISIAQAGVILTAYMMPYGIMQPVYGFFSDRYSKLKTLKIIDYGLAVGTLGCALSQSLFVLSTLRVITGFFAAGIIAVSLGLIGDTVPSGYRQIFVGKFMAIVSLGQGISAVLGGFFATFMNWHIAFLFFGLLTLASAVLLQQLPDRPPVAVEGNFQRELKSVVVSPKGRVIFPFALFTGFLLLGMYGYIGSFLNSRLDLNYLQSGFIVMFFGLSSLTASMLVGKFINNLGRAGTVLSGSCFGLCSGLLLTLFPGWQTAILATVSLGFGCILVQSTLAAMAFDISPQSTGLSSGLIGLCLFGGGGIGTTCAGVILSYKGFETLWLFFSLGILCFIALQILISWNSVFQKKRSQH
ncbi:MFS transporter [Sporolactobacillus shoreae]|uniref:MFS transporter n=1 Tax=Sporolactobacillus shoreae TaxID=1465501 RepID=A0A4Z0GJ31_9BACL|nr:MFS transporter [Sporolactobacillus shoreae]TGA96282.1 MFS transporter [Sporolactobacillus shoreae]